MKTTSPARATLMVTSLFLGGLIAGSLTGAAAVARAQDPYAHLDLFARVLTTIERDYVDQVSADELVDAAIEGMVRRLDRQSRWLSAEQLEHLQEDTQGAATSLGVEITPTDEGVTVTKVLPGSPALRDGLAPGDKILELDGVSLAGLELDAVKSAMEGPRGKGATLTILREGWEEPQKIQTKRDRIHVPSVETALFEQAGEKLAYVRLVQFQEGAAYELEQGFEALARQAGGARKLDGLILDLRDNPGGLLAEAVAVSDLFLDDGPIVSTRGRTGADDAEVHQARPGGFHQNLAVVVLVNGMSASASEIVAAALQETGRGTLVGERTYGKGTVQQVYRHQAGKAALKLTVGRYYTPSGEPVADREGRMPDIQVPARTAATAVDALKQALTDLEVDDEKRAELEALVAALPEPDTEALPIPWDKPPAERLALDPQLQAAVSQLAPEPIPAD